MHTIATGLWSLSVCYPACSHSVQRGGALRFLHGVGLTNTHIQCWAKQHVVLTTGTEKCFNIVDILNSYYTSMI